MHGTAVHEHQWMAIGHEIGEREKNPGFPTQEGTLAVVFCSIHIALAATRALV